MKRLILGVILVMLTSFCQEKVNKNDQNSNRSMTVLLGCNDNEVVSDLNYSVEHISTYLKLNNIKLNFDEQKSECGYVLKDNKNKKYIESALTDIDLINELNSFFNIK